MGASHGGKRSFGVIIRKLSCLLLAGSVPKLKYLGLPSDEHVRREEPSGPIGEH